MKSSAKRLTCSLLLDQSATTLRAGTFIGIRSVASKRTTRTIKALDYGLRATSKAAEERLWRTRRDEEGGSSDATAKGKRRVKRLREASCRDTAADRTFERVFTDNSFHATV